MTPTEFRRRLSALGLTIRGFSDLTGVNVTTAGYWGRERPHAGLQAFPQWVDLLLTAWERHPQPAE